jgi:hypothetical protein
MDMDMEFQHITPLHLRNYDEQTEHSVITYYFLGICSGSYPFLGLPFPPPARQPALPLPATTYLSLPLPTDPRHHNDSRREALNNRSIQ